MKIGRCAACGREFEKRSETSKQSFCSNPKCQRERRRRWQKNRRASDPDYKDNQVRAQKSWMKRNREYWKNYRATHPTYAEDNRQEQRKRNSPKDSEIAKMDASRTNPEVISGIYQLIPLKAGEVAKMDALIVEIRFISSTSKITTSKR